MTTRETTITDYAGDTLEVWPNFSGVTVIAAAMGKQVAIELTAADAREVALALTGDSPDDGPVDDAVIGAVDAILRDHMSPAESRKRVRDLAAAGLLVRHLPAQKTPPVGQIRREGGLIATRTASTSWVPWVVMDPTKKSTTNRSDADVADWETIYTPEEGH